jgi:FMN phosphatase YigB (HAD superfamily)
MRSRPSAIVWDLDNTLYRQSETFYGDCYAAAAEAAIEAGFAGDPAAARAIAEHSYRRHRYSVAEFFHAQGLDRALVETRYIERIVRLIEATEETRAFVASIRVLQLVLSHSPGIWVDAVLEKLGLDVLIAPRMRICSEEIGFDGKSRSMDAYLLALDRLGTRAADTVAIDDTAGHLQQAKAAGLTTVHLSRHRNGRDEAEAYIDYVIREPADLANHFLLG